MSANSRSFSIWRADLGQRASDAHAAISDQHDLVTEPSFFAMARKSRTATCSERLLMDSWLCGHDAFHEVCKQWHRERRVSVGGTVNHSLFDESISYGRDTLYLHLHSLGDVAGPLGCVTHVRERAQVVFFTRSQAIEANAKKIRVQSPY
jgi:hypothetical protein